MWRLIASGSQSIGALASAPVLPMNIQGWFPFGLTCLILLPKRLSRDFSSTRAGRHQFFGTQSFSLSSSHIQKGFPVSSDGKESACNVGNPGSIPGSGRSPGEGNGYPLQHSFLENSMERGAWQTTVHGVAKSQTWLNDWHFHFHIHTWLLDKP